MANYFDRKQRIFDHIPNYRFHVMDVSFSTPVVLNLSYGFSRVTAPEIVAETKEIKSGTFEYKKSYIVGASASEVVLEQGVSIFNSDFYDWVIGAVKGQMTNGNSMRRNILILQFSDLNILPDQTSDSTVGTFGGGDIAGIAGGVASLIGLDNLIQRVPARAWMLHDAIPTAYKGGSDMDALGNEISIASLTLKPYYVSEFSFGI